MMGNKIGTLQKPVVMTKAFLEEKIIWELARVEDLNISELQRLVKMDGIERNLVLSLQLEHQSLLNISNLWKFTLLTKLVMANNYIEEIEGLETLSNLQHLDLSFNCIKVIKGLDGLINLEYLNLSYNEITHLENLDNQKNLETLLVRHNKIKSFENMLYIAQFENLFCLGIEENPLMEMDNGRLRVLGVLPQLKFLDFILVTENELQEALLLYPVENKAESKDKLFENYGGKDCSSLWEIHPSDKEAFIDGLANGHGFEALLEGDKNFRLLHSFPPAATIAIPKKLCLIYQKPISSEQKDKEVEQLKDVCDKELRETHKNLMSCSCLYLDIIFDLMRTFKSEMHLIVQNYLEDVQHIYKEIIKTDERHILELQQFYFNIFNTGSNYDLEVNNQAGEVIELDPLFVKLLTKKDFVEMALKMAFTIHSTLLQERIKKLRTTLENYHEEILNSLLEKDILIKQSEKIRNVLLFCNKQKYIMDKLFYNSMKFKNYLGYC
ncbi:dynein regulatory complex subunit 3-like isoform X1 [Argiope bruennichi]|uniref:dynein regulatory complex subunit 3-like isoform X1 n=2 Tax=Argiope bruennichi TaxID=94029 RepID=UPI002493F9FE|nr:dynein regulatory complex subunit 3-like isoform X1 [Argiope bruennichi]